MNRSAIDKITPPCFISFIFVYNPSTAETIQWMERFQTALSKLKELYPIFEHDIPIETNNQSTTLLESGFDATNPANSFQNISKWPRYLTQDISHDKSIFSAKITTFTCGGVAVGFNFQHGVFDGAGACKILQNLSHFMDTGAWLDKGDDTMNRSEIFNNVMKMADSAKCNDGSYLAIPSSDLAKLQTEQSAEPIEGGLRLVRLQYEEIEKLREQMNSEEGRSVFSINDIVCSLLWFLFIQQHPLDKLSWKYLFVLDSRRPLKNYLSETYTGNSVIVRQVAVNGSKSDIKLLDLCKATRKTITDSLDQKNIAETLLWFEKSLNDNKLVIQNFRLNPPSGFPDLLISNWYRFPLYDISLGMGSPIYGGCPPFAPSMAGVGLLKPLPKTKDILLAMNMPDCVFGALSHSPIFHSSVTIE